MLGLNLNKKAAIFFRKNLNLNEDEEEIVAYSIEMIFLNLFTLATICLVAVLLGCFATTLITSLAIFSLRILSGGVHSESPLNCTLLSVILVVSIGKIANIYGNEIPILWNVILIFMVFLTSFKFIWLLAPVDSHAKPITSENHRKQLRKLSLIVVVSIFVLQLIMIDLNYKVFSQFAFAATLGVAWQTFTLTITGHKFVHAIDSTLNKLKRR